MDTCFAPAERAKKEEFLSEIAIVKTNPVMTGLLHSITGLLAILDEHRQILALNDSFLKMLGIDDPAEALGLQPGEALQCIHAHEEPAGCGTTRFCSTCGAAIAIVTSLQEAKPAERLCALATRRGEQEVDIVLLVKSHPIELAGERFLLLFLQDVTLQQQRAALERTFFHDVNSMLSGLLGASEMLFLEKSHSDLVKMIYQSSVRLKHEVAIQKCLLQSEARTYQPL